MRNSVFSTSFNTALRPLHMDNTKPFIIIASDHAAIELKSYLLDALKQQDYNVFDCGTHHTDSVDYPDFADKLADQMQQNPHAMGILLCGSGIGISIAANRHSHIRAALCFDTEMAKLSREHNDANVIAMGARFIQPEIALSMLHVFLTTPFAQGRHTQRVQKLTKG